MFGSTDPHRFRKTIAGLCMIGAPVLFLVSTIVSPKLDADEGTLIGIVASNQDRFLASTLVALAGWAAFAVAILGVMHMLRERGVTFGHLGGGLALIGTLAAVGNTAVSMVIWAMADGDRGQMTALLERITGSAATAVPLFFLTLGVTIGALVLAWGLTSTKAAPMWMTGAIALSAVLYAIGSITFSVPVLLAASAVLLVGMGSLGRVVLEETVDEWEHTPEFHGFHALGSH